MLRTGDVQGILLRNSGLCTLERYTLLGGRRDDFPGWLEVR